MKDIDAALKTPPSLLTMVIHCSLKRTSQTFDSHADLRLGSSTVRAGWSFDSKPRLTLPPLMARYRDRKLNRTFTFVGSDIYSDGTARGQSKNVYDPGSNIVNNWDAMEGVLDYCFIKL